MVNPGVVFSFIGLVLSMSVLIWVLVCSSSLLYMLMTHRKTLQPAMGGFLVFFGWVVTGMILSRGIGLQAIVEDVIKGRIGLGIVPPGINLHALCEGILISMLVWLGLSSAHQLNRMLTGSQKSERESSAAHE